MIDQRKEYLASRLRNLDSQSLIKVVDYDKPLCTDTYSYDEATGFICTFAVAVGVAELNIPDLTNNKVVELINDAGYTVGSPSGIPGNFYTTNRESDIRRLCEEILLERGEATGDSR
jgi:hypothetical protein